MAVRKIGNSWRVDFWFGGTRYRVKGPQNSKAGAAAYEVVLRQKLARGESIERVAKDEEITFAQFAQKWLEGYVVANNKHSEQRSKKYVLDGALVPFFGNIPIKRITSHHVEQFKAEMITKRGISNKTIKNYLTVLNKCLITAYEWKDLDGAPPKIKWPKCAPSKMDYLSPDECESLLSHSEGIVHELILTALRTGMRQGELKGLQWSSIDWENRSVAVRHSRDDRMKMLVPPKSNRIRHVPLDIDVYDLLFKRKQNTGYVFSDTDGEPFDYHRMERRLTRACKEAQLRKIGWHTLRHTFASHLAMRGVPLPTVQELMGHSNITTTMRYAHVAPSTLRTAIEVLNPKNFGHHMGTEWIEAHRETISLKNISSKSR